MCLAFSTVRCGFCLVKIKENSSCIPGYCPSYGWEWWQHFLFCVVSDPITIMFGWVCEVNGAVHHPLPWSIWKWLDPLQVLFLSLAILCLPSLSIITASEGSVVEWSDGWVVVVELLEEFNPAFQTLQTIARMCHTFLNVVVNLLVLSTQPSESMVECVVLMFGCCVFEVGCDLVSELICFYLLMDLLVELLVRGLPALLSFACPQGPGICLGSTVKISNRQVGKGALHNPR